jgi:hypothetical protein
LSTWGARRVSHSPTHLPKHGGSIRGWTIHIDVLSSRSESQLTSNGEGLPQELVMGSPTQRRLRPFEVHRRY